MSLSGRAEIGTLLRLDPGLPGGRAAAEISFGAFIQEVTIGQVHHRKRVSHAKLCGGVHGPVRVVQHFAANGDEIGLT
jgi:hypothetical protein